ncbi:MAG: carboxypeptidase regulatory-like domain-containing protein [Planctomycetaceae bacterium]|nr:carboxypeptidase regulatory-like domain-containing protein [Planctomycetaceae bacterium]
MTIPHDFTADLPPPRDDEPASLRQDIIDELTDHLECATRRELLASGGRQSPVSDELTTAQSRALTRFGNPAKIARRLWLDAMQEKLMAQKITLTLASVATVACIVLCVLMWQALHQGQEAQAALLQQHQEFTQALLKEFQSLRSNPEALPPTTGWSQLTMRLVSESGEPVEGQVTISGTPIGGERADVNFVRDVGPDGQVDIGLVPYGNYQAKVVATEAQETHTEHFMVTPSEKSDLTIVCPTEPPPAVDLSFAFNPPELLQTADICYIVSLKPHARRYADSDWNVTVEGSDGSLDLWVDASGEILNQFAKQWGQLAGSGMPAEAQGLKLHPKPILREYLYELSYGRVVYPLSTVPSGYSYVDKMAIPSDATYSPARGTMSKSLEPRHETENLWKIEFSDNMWARIIQDFRQSEEARNITIPEGWEAVTVKGDRIEGRVTVHERTNVMVGLDSEEGFQGWNLLISSAEVISMSINAGSGFAGQEHRYVLLVRPDQKQALTLAQSRGLKFFLRESDEDEDEPVLHESVLEEIEALPVSFGSPRRGHG